MDSARAAALDGLGAFRLGIPVKQIAQLVGHSGTTVTELVYRHQLKPVI
jgi:integrase